VNRVYRLVWNVSHGMFVPVTELSRARRKKSNRAQNALIGGMCALLLGSGTADATSFLDFTTDLSDWTVKGGVTTSTSTVAFTIGGSPFSLTPASGYTMARITANGGVTSPNALLGLSANSLESFLNNSYGSITNFGLMTKSYDFDVGTYSFAWAYAAEDYQPYNDGAIFTLSGAGTQSLYSLARNGSSPTDLSGPSPYTQILGSYGSTAWLATTFEITTAGTYQVGFGAYNWGDTSLSPNLFISGVAGTFTGDAVETSGPTPPPPPPPAPPVIGGSGGNVAPDTYDPTSPAYAAGTLTFEGGTLQYTADTTTSKDAVLNGPGGAIDTNGTTVNYTGEISGTGAFTKAGTGTLVLTNDNTFTGTTEISGGTLALTGTGNISESAGIVNNGTFDISGTTDGTSVTTMSGNGAIELGSKTLTLSNASGTFGGVINGSGGVEVAAGTMTLSGANTYTGTTTISGGTLALTGTGSLGSSEGVVNNATLDISSTNTGASVKTMSGSGTVELGSKNLTFTDAADTFNGAINGSGGIELAGGTLTLAGANTYTGTTTILDGGTLKLSGSGTLGNSSGVVNNGALDLSEVSATHVSMPTISGGGSLEMGAKNLVITDSSGIYSGAISGSGSVNLDGGTLALTGSNTFSGGVNVSNGATLVASSGAALGDAAGTLTLNDSAFVNSGTFSLPQAVAIQGSGLFDVASDSALTTAGSISGSGNLIKSGAGTLVLAGDNSSLGTEGTSANIIVDEGVLEVASANGLGNANLVLNSGKLSTLSSSVITGNVALAGNTSIATADQSTLTIAAPITTIGTADGCFEKTGSGTLVMAGQASISAGTCVQEGKLYANGLLNSVVTVQTNGTLRGTGVISGPITVHGVLAPGNSPGTLQVAAPVTMTAGSTYQQDINGLGTGAGPGNYSRLIITGAENQFVATGATLAPNLVNITGSDTYVPYVPSIGDAFRIITAEGGIVGEFASITQPEGLAEATRMEVFYNFENSNSVDLFVVPTSYGAYVKTQDANENAVAVATSLDTLVQEKAAGLTTEDEEALLYVVSAQPGATLAATATALSGEVHGALAAAAPMANRWLTDSVGRQLARDSAFDAEGTRGVWVDVGANRSDWRSDAAASGFDTTRSQVAIGWNLIGEGRSRLGVGFTHGKSDVSARLGSGSVTHNIGFVYGQVALSRFVIDGLAAAGSSDWETDRPDPLAPASVLATEVDGRDAVIAAGVRLPLNTKNIALSPYARATWERLSRDGFDEGVSSSSALSAGSYSASGTRFTAGLQGGSPDEQAQGAPLSWHFNAGIGRDAKGLAQPRFDVSLAGLNTTLTTPDVSRTFVFGEVSATARIAGRLHGYFGVSGEARSGKSEDLGANLGVRMTF